VSTIGRGKWIVTGGLILLYVAAWAAASRVFDTQQSDLDLFFWPSAETAANGHVLQVYSAHSLASYPNANGPLGLLPLIPIVILANHLGWANDITLRAALSNATFAIFALLLAFWSLRLIERARGGLEWRVAASCVFLVAPALWIAVANYGHIEQPVELWLVAVAAGLALTKRYALGGVVLGLALITRTTALLYVIPFVSLPLAGRRIMPSTTVLGLTAITAVVGLLPFYLANGPNVVHSLITYRGDLPIGGGSFWVITLGTPLAGLAQHGDVYLIVGVAALATIVTVWLRPAAATTTAGFFGLLTVVAACFPMLAKTVLPYYLLEPYTFAAIWWLARPGSALNWRLAVPFLLTVDVFVAKWGVTLPFTGLGLVEGVVSSAILAAVIAMVVTDLLRARTVSPGEPSKEAAQRRVLSESVR
jgi:hypothetical protein